MSRARRIMWVAVACLVMLPFASAAAAADSPLTLASQTAKYNAASNRVVFTIRFTRPPDFFTIDGLGRAADSFQYFIVGDPSAPYPLNYTSVIRGDEIRFDGLITIRNVDPPDADARAGGWGTIRGEVPYSLHGRMLRFSVPLALLTSQTSGTVDYLLETYSFGELGSHVEGSFALKG